MATDPTTPTPEQLRTDSAWLAEAMDDIRAWGSKQFEDDWLPVFTRAALALEEQAARMEQPTAELRGWGVKRPDGTLAPVLFGTHWPADTETVFSEDDLSLMAAPHGVSGGVAVRVRLVAEGE